MEEARSINIDFFETYIHLDDMCRERHGFSASDYINQMVQTPVCEQALVPNWERNYKKFRRMRHLRNELAHGHNAFDTELCTKSDISWLKSMCYKIENQSDPLTLLDVQKEYQKSKKKISNAKIYKRVAIGVTAIATLSAALITAIIEHDKT